jgi:hypothetical protein
MPLELPPKFPHGFPVRENCDPADAYQAFLWMLVAWPVPLNNPLRIPLPFWQLLSKRLWDLGVRPAAEPVLVYQRDPGSHALFAAGRFLPESNQPRPFPHVFPLRENCDPGNPYHVFLWMLAGPPGVYGGPLLLGVDDLQMVSKQLWDLGARPVEEPLLRYVRPTGRENDWLTTPGRWLSVDDVAPGGVT